MEIQEIKTSIIIPVYNTKDYLEACIESVLMQKQKEIEIILIDDGSTDGSSEIIKKYDEKYPFIKAIYQENQKLGAARNAGVKIVKGKYIYFLDSDDYIREDLLERCYQKADENQLDFVMFDSQVVVESEEMDSRCTLKNVKYDRTALQIEERVYSGIEFWNKYYSLGGVYPNAVLVYVNTEFLLNNQIFFEPGVYYEDNDWMVRMFYCAKRISYIAQQFYFRRVRVGSIMTSNYGFIHLKSCVLLCEKIGDMLIYSKDISFKNMLLPVLEIMLMKFEDVFKYWNENQMQELKSIDILEFYNKLVYMYDALDETQEEIKNILLVVACTIRKRAEKGNAFVEIPDFDIEEYQRKLVTKELLKYPLNKKQKRIGIYGSGLMCDRFLNLYQSYMGTIRASVFFIDSYKNSGEKYKGYPLYNIRDVERKTIDYIIIASSRYREILLGNVEKLVKKNKSDLEILCLPKYVQFYDG